MTASSIWIDGPIIWLLALVVFVLLLCVRCAREERRLAKLDKDHQAEIIPITKGRKL